MHEYGLEVGRYIDALPDDRKVIVQQFQTVVNQHMPPGFQEVVSYGMLSYVVPHSIYPSGYHCNPKQPLPFLSIASQKNFIAIYHMGLYASEPMLTWFTSEWPKYSVHKLDMGKSCIRLKKLDAIPFALFGKLFSKMSAQEWVALYEKNYKRK